jgi:hypothetical protein
MDGNILRRIDSDAHLVAFHAEYGNAHGVTDHQCFTYAASQNQHVVLLLRILRFLVFLTNGRPVAVATMPPAKPALQSGRREAALASPLVRATAESPAPVYALPQRCGHRASAGILAHAPHLRNE